MVTIAGSMRHGLLAAIVLSSAPAVGLAQVTPSLSSQRPAVPSANAATTAVDPHAEPTIEEIVVPETPVRRAEATLVVPCAFPIVAARMRDFTRYPDFLRRLRGARVIHRNRAETDVYFQVELPRALGVYWFLQHMTVVASTPERLEITGLSTDGNVGHIETRVRAERVRGAVPATRLRFSLLGVPVFPALPSTVTAYLRDAVRGATLGLRDACAPR